MLGFLFIPIVFLKKKFNLQNCIQGHEMVEIGI